MAQGGDQGDFRQKLRVWAALPEVSMRASAVAELLRDADSEHAVGVLQALIVAALGRNTKALSVYAGLLDPAPAAALIGHARLEALLATAQALGLDGAQQWLYGARREAELERGDHVRQVHRDLRELTLGQRRALARRATGEALKKLVVDPDPEVVRNLLNNPRTTESMVLAICSKRPTLSAPLRAVLNSSRFGQRYRVRFALAQNPHLEERLAVNLFVCLDPKDLEAVAEDGTLQASRRTAARRLRGLLDSGPTAATP